MARITVEDCLKQIPSRFKLIHLAIQRVKQLRRGATPFVKCDNKEIVVALREIASGQVNFSNIKQLGKEIEEFPLADLLELGKSPSEKQS